MKKKEIKKEFDDFALFDMDEIITKKQIFTTHSTKPSENDQKRDSDPKKESKKEH